MSIGTFQWVDPPPEPVLNAPPALPAFLDGLLVRQGDLASLTANIRYLRDNILGVVDTPTGPVYRPTCVLRAVTPAINSFSSGVATLIRWDQVDLDPAGMFDPAVDAFAVTVPREGFWRIGFQCGHVSTTHSQCQMHILVNGTDIDNNTVQYCRWKGLSGNLEVTTPLPTGSSISLAFSQSTGSSVLAATDYGGVRVEVGWVAPSIPILSAT